MGNESSNNRNSEESNRRTTGVNNSSTSQQQAQFSEVEVAELLERQKQHFEKKQQELLKIQRVQAANLERARAPYSYSQSQLNPVSTQTLYPNLNSVQYQTQSNVLPPVIFNNIGHGDRNMPVPSAPPAPRDRSTTRPRPARNNRKNDSEGETKCRTCNKMYGMTIFQCSEGHSSCSECKGARRPCGICRRTITDMRNITLEGLIAEMKVKCTYSEDGCNLFIKMADLKIHTKECPFREMPCPLFSTFGCLWKGKLSQIETHFDNTHPISRQGAVDTEMTLNNLKNNSHIAQLIVLGSFHFVFHLVVSQNQEKVYMAVQLIGTNISASKWTYEIHVYNKSQPRRKYQYTDACLPINNNINEIMSESKCAILPLPYAATFASDNKLNYKFYIKKDPNERPFGKNNRGRGGHRAQTRT